MLLVMASTIPTYNVSRDNSALEIRSFKNSRFALRF